MAQKELLLYVIISLFYSGIARAEGSFKKEDLEFAKALAEKSLQMTLPQMEAKWQELRKMLGLEWDHNSLGTLGNKREWGTCLRIFVSSSMSKNLLKNYAQQARNYKGVLVFNGLPQGSWHKLSELITEVSGSAPELVTIQIDDEAFDLFNIKEVPSFVLSKEEGTLTKNPKVIFDKVSGSIGVRPALEIFAARGELKEFASKLLKREDSK